MEVASGDDSGMPSMRVAEPSAGSYSVVLAEGNEERVLLNSPPEAEAAQAAYRSWGYRKAGEAHPWESAPLHDVMVRQLR